MLLIDWLLCRLDFICGLGFSMCYIFIPYGDIVMFIFISVSVVK